MCKLHGGNSLVVSVKRMHLTADRLSLLHKVSHLLLNYLIAAPVCSNNSSKNSVEIYIGILNKETRWPDCYDPKAILCKISMLMIKHRSVLNADELRRTPALIYICRRRMIPSINLNVYKRKWALGHPRH